MFDILREPLHGKFGLADVPHDTLLTKLNREFGVTGSLLDLIRSYLSDRQCTVLNGVKSELLPVSMWIPQGSVL